jgi:serine protein kinase
MTEHNFLDELSSSYQEAAPMDLRDAKSFEWYLSEVVEHPEVARNAHQRLADMFDFYGTEYDEKQGYTEYLLTSEDPLHGGRNRFFGRAIHHSIHEFVSKVKSGARGLGPEKRIVLMLGPVGSGKSAFDQLMRTYFEEYTGSDEGRMYTFRWTNLYDVVPGQDPDDDVVQSPMNQDPLVLLPQAERNEVLEHSNESLDAPYTLRNEQSLDPASEFYMGALLEHYDENLGEVLRNHIEVVRLVADENKRQCVETFEPKDKKNQDETELTGDVNYGKIAVYGESDPRSFDYSGAFCNANRGIFSGEELLKLQKEFLYDFLHATQEQTIKPKNNPRIDIDQVIVGRTNMPEYRDKRSDETMEAFNDRTKRVDYPYVLEFDAETHIYEKLLSNADVPEVHVEPHTLEMAALFSVLTRLEEPDDEKVSLVEKAHAYNDWEDSSNATFVEKLEEETEEEGMFGVSPRFVGDEIANAIQEAIEKAVDVADELDASLSALSVLRYLEENLELHGSIPTENYEQYERFLGYVREDYKERAIEDVRHALAYDIEEIQTQGEKYMDHVMAYIGDSSIEDELTGIPQEPDEKFMRAAELELDIPEARKDDFRQEIANWVSRRAREGTSFDPLDNKRLRRALEAKNWNDKKHNISFAALVASGDTDADDRNAWISALIEQGYSEPGANEVLEFAGAEVAKSALSNDDDK